MHFCLQITSVFGCIVRMTSELEANLVAVERTKEYTELTNEVCVINPLLTFKLCVGSSHCL